MKVFIDFCGRSNDFEPKLTQRYLVVVTGKGIPNVTGECCTRHSYCHYISCKARVGSGKNKVIMIKGLGVGPVVCMYNKRGSNKVIRW